MWQSVRLLCGRCAAVVRLLCGWIDRDQAVIIVIVKYLTITMILLLACLSSTLQY